MATYPLKVLRRRQESEDAVSLWLDVPNDLRTAFTYRTGQFIAIEEEFDGEEITRQYSLASVPGLDEHLHISVKRIPGGRMSTHLVDSVADGDLLEVVTPRGRLYTPSQEPRHILLLAAGSGIVPLLAIARDALHSGAGHRVTLVYGNRHTDSVMLREEVEALAADGAVVEHVLSRPDPSWTGARGRVDPAYLESRWAQWTAECGLPVSAYLCGPEAFMSDAEEFLTAHGVGIDDIRKESFDLVLDDDGDEADLLVPGDAPAAEPEPCTLLTAVLGGENIEVTPEPGEPLLSALLRVSDDVPFSCQEGTCSSCIVKLTEGQVGVRPGVTKTLRPADLEEGLILACLSRARTESVHIDFDDI
ncbi:ferredoxin--NADP reductase [Streptomyces sp. NPDC047002]|uniref:ferredoxin--NADP reductase n=1 Tax=Streptomyces sp. NPDC047002 TaxID=3155475 RepID=UPI00345436E8